MKFRWKRFALVALPVSAIILFPIWHRWIDPSFYADVRCIKPAADGSIVTASGDDCAAMSEPTLVLRRD